VVRASADSVVPNPKSETRLICAVKANPYQACDTLEDRSGNDNSPNSLKAELEEILGEPATSEKLNPMVSERQFDCHQIKMKSFQEFRKQLVRVVKPSDVTRPPFVGKRSIQLRPGQ
jgi:hypothetical protein